MIVTLIRRQLRNHWKLLLTLCLALVALETLIVTIAAQIDMGPGFQTLIEQLVPSALQTMIGAQLGTLSFSGLTAFGFQHPAMLTAMIAFVIVVCTIPPAERDSGFLELMLARPVRRRAYFSSVAAFFVFGALILPASVLTGAGLGLQLVEVPGELAWTRYAASAGLMCTLLLAIGGCTLLLACGARRRGPAAARAVGFILVAYWVDVLAQLWSPLEILRWLSPFGYYRPIQAAVIPQVTTHHPIVLLAVFAITTALAYRRFELPRYLMWRLAFVDRSCRRGHDTGAMPRTDAKHRRSSAQLPQLLVVLTVLSILSLPLGIAASDDDDGDGDLARQDRLLDAITAELTYTMENLGSADSPSLYFLGYEARDQRSWTLGARLGAIRSESESHDRSLDVDVRVGNRRLDNTHQIKGNSGRFEFPAGSSTDLPLDDDALALRTAIWAETDSAYKKALNRYAKVKTNQAVTTEDEDASADFSIEEPITHYAPIDWPEVDVEAWSTRLRRLSAALKPYPFVYGSGVTLTVQAENRYVVNSEGTCVVTGRTLVRLSVGLTSRTEDGMGMQRSRSFDAARTEDLPDDETILAEIAAAADQLQALLAAPLIDPFTGPAIFRNRATAVFFHEILGHRLEGHRQKLEAEGQTFTSMIGRPVVADFISVYDDPTLRSYNGRFLRGYYLYDNEGVPAQRATLVENGTLRGFLLSRTPVEGFERSNGHGRRSAGRFTVARMANTIVEASESVPYERLRELLVEEIRRQEKPYGLIFDDISGGFTSTGRGGGQSFKVIPLLVYRVYADGRPDETVRGVDIVGTPLASFGKIAAAADDVDIFNGSCGAESGWVAVSAVAPSVLVTEIEVEKKAKSSERPPILPLPHHDEPVSP